MPQYITHKEVQEILGIKQAAAYDMIRKLNNELKEKGFLTVAGRCPRKYFAERTGYDVDEQIKKDA